MIAYRLYGTFMAAKVLKLNDSKPTPAHKLEDGRDYVPTNKWVTFGHHFAAIAAAGPLVGPILAAQFGYLPGLLWLSLGQLSVEPSMIWLFCLHRCVEKENPYQKLQKKNLDLLQVFVQV